MKACVTYIILSIVWWNASTHLVVKAMVVERRGVNNLPKTRVGITNDEIKGSRYLVVKNLRNGRKKVICCIKKLFKIILTAPTIKR